MLVKIFNDKIYIEESIEKKQDCKMLTGEKKIECSSNRISVPTEAKENNAIPSGLGVSFEANGVLTVSFSRT